MPFIKHFITVCLLCGICAIGSFAQVTGGQSAFEYLRMPNSPHISALGGICVANPTNDIAFAVQNPALMRPGLHNLLDLDYNAFYGDINVLNMQYGYYVPKYNLACFAAVQYLNYGSISQTDNTGNELGTLHPSDYSLTAGASGSYGEHWRYGADLKFAHSNLVVAKASAVLADVGVNYYDSVSGWDFAAVAKNMGSMTTVYTSGNIEPLPFDLQIGATKALKHVPLKLFVTLHHLYEWDIRYDDPSLVTPTNALTTTDSNKSSSGNLTDKFFRHFIFGAELNIAKRITFTVSYNDLQRRELALTTLPGLAGFAFGIGFHLNVIEVHYARTYYHIAGPYNEIGLTLPLHKMFGIGELGEKIHWNTEYNDW